MRCGTQRGAGGKERGGEQVGIQGARRRNRRWEVNSGGKDRRLDLGLQDAPRSTIYTTDQVDGPEGAYSKMASRKQSISRGTQQSR